MAPSETIKLAVDLSELSQTGVMNSAVVTRQYIVSTAVITAGVLVTYPSLTFTPVSNPTYVANTLVADSTNDSLTYFNSDPNVSLQIGQETWIRVINNSGSTIANSAAVYINGSSAGMPTVALARADAAATTVCAGLATETIPNGATGFITAIGLVNGIDTSAFTTGTVFLSATVAGALTQTAPLAPNFRYRVGFVTNVNAITGKIHVTPSTASLGNGTANQLFGMNTAGTAQEVKTLTAGTGIGVSSGTNTLTVSVSRAVATVTTTGNVLATNYLTRVNSAGATNQTLPTATLGTEIIIKNINTGVVTLIGTIDGVVNPTLASQYKYTHIMGNGTNWDVIGNN